MDIAVLSDIHGNYIALKRCLEYAFSQNISTFFFLGDYIGELAYPERTMKILYDLNERYKCYFIKGNKEDYWLNYRANGEKGWKDKDSTSGSLLYAYKSLTARDLDFFAQLQSVQEITVSGMAPITICHGSPDKINEKMLPDDDRTIQIINGVETSIILCGHSHVQRKIVHNEKCILNPGSVGVPLFSEGNTQFLILHGNDGVWLEEFISLEYDVLRVIRDMHEAKLYEHAPYWSMITETILRGGNTSHSKVLTRAMELCREETGDCVWPNIPEKCWEQAVNELIL
ncbi:metallophosphoesterase family protein [Clostridium cellulovorans]|uniref:Metallophosphoesterase n=1 Tax=Clostridium cellulovorans (strain ATCC 35296 / DSM 3052 / OCM 3 / 743B) TaxID=573061 RepID=D9SNR9_CLOC7|nr:metallophosphoesterase family protein [Clostridium cellulovorans]ADL49940.1 metallophosphoesterase [Clostridium cellulovorans 743B]